MTTMLKISLLSSVANAAEKQMKIGLDDEPQRVHARVFGDEEGPPIDSMFNQMVGTVSDYFGRPASSTMQLKEIVNDPAEPMDQNIASPMPVQSFEVEATAQPSGSSFLEVSVEATAGAQQQKMEVVGSGFSAVETQTVNPEPYIQSVIEPGPSDLGIVHAFGGDPIASTLRLLKSPVDAVKKLIDGALEDHGH